jgi:hypothetical protein
MVAAERRWRRTARPPGPGVAEDYRNISLAMVCFCMLEVPS